MNTLTRTSAFGVLLALAATAAAQTAPSASPSAPAESPAVTLDAVIVTGSNLRRADVENALPVSVIDRDALEARDGSTPIELLVTLPQVVNVPLNETATLGATARGDNSSISLRGLSSGNTLVLLNGRRLAPHPISAAEGDVPALSPNVNQLPNRGLDRIEVLRDGASSIYGTDAVAGVVNYLFDRSYRGTEVRTRYGYADAGGGDEYRATILHGRDFAGGRGRVVTTLDWFKREAVQARERPFSAENDLTARAPAPWNDFSSDSDFFFRSSASAFGNFLTGTLSAGGTFTGARPAGVPSSLVAASGSFFLVPTATGVGFKTSTPARTGVERDYYYNLSADRTLQPKSMRLNWHTSLEYDLSDRLTAFADLGIYHAESSATREPDSAARTTDGELYVPTTNPFNPFGERFWHPTGAPNSDGTPRLTGTPATLVIVNKRFMDLGTRVFDVDSDVYRLTGGLRGKLADTWSWESAALYTLAATRDEEARTTRESLFQDALNQTSPATAYNPFGYTFAVQGGALVVAAPYANPRSVIDTFQRSFVREGETSIASWDFRATGDALTLWGGNKATAAVGAEYRHETYSDERPPFAGLNPPGSNLDPLDNDFLAFSPNSDTHADRDVVGAYAELNVPLAGGRFTPPLVHALDVTAAVRYEEYSDFGDTTKPKVGFTWRPARWMVVRGSYNEGFRAPNLAQLFTGELIRSTSQTDSYRSTVTGLPSDGSVNRLFRRSGNQDLRPEEAEGRSAGIFIDVPFVKGLSVSADYWEIRQEGAISTAGGVTDDTNALIAATQAALAAGQNINSIDLGSGTAAYQGDPSVERNPVTQADRDAFAAYNATRAPSAQRAVVGTIAFINETYFNRAERFTNGWDFGATYRLPFREYGTVTLSTEWTYVRDAHAYDSAGAPRNDLRWQSGAPIWKGNAGVTWRQGDWRAGLSAHYTGDFQDADGSTTQAVWESLGRPGYIVETFDAGSSRYRYLVDATTTFNGYVSYRLRTDNDWLDDTTIRLGVINLTDEQPPLAADSRGYTTNQYMSLARGRVWSIEITKRL
ncbi:MAG TPA: TonB-dependent receptor [Opitutaceae bacterium]|nr:TonB-dependent receptor [Opitutaceae bacterium]